ncbi:tyrosine-type recombinase/integrase [Nocardia ignorata]|uniref:Phage integrase family protein n=1 Tax=Nocardia ignorata TaxID=145285 RepID=A0A4R6PHV2_NOCIG|nr:tyrosine-type recombinase/integrase [Nocardia ignorata]TDP37657.1 phage integrase family protein [Nocardia ignorata]
MRYTPPRLSAALYVASGVGVGWAATFSARSGHRGYVALLKLDLGGLLSSSAARITGEKYCAAAEVDIEMHQLRHAGATELINSSIEFVRRRLGHASTETTQIYTSLADNIADDEIRGVRRRRSAG